MMPGAQEGLSLQQAPPLRLPLAFFLTAPVFLVAAGLSLAWGGSALLSGPWSTQTVALVHLFTLGFLAHVVMGALYQMIPVVAGRPVPWVRLAGPVHLALAVGASALALGIGSGSATLIIAGGVALSFSFVAFLVPVAVALALAPARSATVWGMRLSALGLLSTVLLGLGGATMHAGLAAVPHRPTWLMAHVGAGVVVWAGGLLMAVSWQVVPMFYVTQPFHPRASAASLVALSLTLAAGVITAGLGLFGAPVAPIAPWLTAAVGLGGLVVWAHHPVTVLTRLARRGRKRRDGSVRFWVLGMVSGLLCLPLALAAWYSPSVSPMIWGWVALWGWLGATMHGMLYRIVPFLVWFHRFSPLLGKVRVPAMRNLLPDPRVQGALLLHSATLGVGLVALLTTWAWAATLTGLLLAGTGALLLANLLAVLRVPVPPLPQS